MSIPALVADALAMIAAPACACDAEGMIWAANAALVELAGGAVEGRPLVSLFCAHTAAAIPGTLVSLAAGGRAHDAVRFGHPSGTLRVGAEARQEGGDWVVTKAVMSRSSRVLMEGWVRVPGDAF